MSEQANQLSEFNPQLDPAQAAEWRRMTPQEQAEAWEYILNSPLGIAALNQLAIEGFISPDCTKNFYTNDKYGGFQFLLQVESPELRGASTAKQYKQMRVIFNRFETNIENFEVERVYLSIPPAIDLPE